MCSVTINSVSIQKVDETQKEDRDKQIVKLSTGVQQPKTTSTRFTIHTLPLKRAG